MNYAHKNNDVIKRNNTHRSGTAEIFLTSSLKLQKPAYSPTPISMLVFLLNKRSMTTS